MSTQSAVPASLLAPSGLMGAPRAAPFHEQAVAQWQAQPQNMAVQSMPAAFIHPSGPQLHPPPFESVLDFTYHQHVAPSGAPVVSGTPADILQPSYSINAAIAAGRQDVDWKQPSFYSYRPNEVKHRKRTTRQQLKILEETFRKTQKPDGNIRKTLALQLNMTPRNVQVWFQNRRAKDKTLAKRALKAVEEEQLRESHTGEEEVDRTKEESVADIHPTSTGQVINTPVEAGAAVNSLLQASNGIYSSPEAIEDSFMPQYHSRQSSYHAEAMSQIAVPTPIRHRVVGPPFSRLSSSSSSAGSYAGDMPHHAQVDSALPQAYPVYDTEATGATTAPMARDILAPRGSLPLIRNAAAYNSDIHHQRSVSSPTFPNNVESTNVSYPSNANANGVHSLYHQQYQHPMSQQPDSQNLFHNHPALPLRVPRVPPGPLPASNFTFGASPISGPPSATSGELEEDDYSARLASYDRLRSLTRSDTMSSLSSYSQFSSVASLSDADIPKGNGMTLSHRDEDSYLWLDRKHDPASHLVENYGAVALGPTGVEGHPLYPSPVSQGISPHSGYSSGSPARPGTALSVKAESVSSDSGLFIASGNNWTTGYRDYEQGVQSAPLSQTPSPTHAPGGNATHDTMAFQHGMYGYTDHQASVFSSNTLENPLTGLAATAPLQQSVDSAAVYPEYAIRTRHSQEFGYDTMASRNYYLQAC